MPSNGHCLAQERHRESKLPCLEPSGHENFDYVIEHFLLISELKVDVIRLTTPFSAAWEWRGCWGTHMPAEAVEIGTLAEFAKPDRFS